MANVFLVKVRFEKAYTLTAASPRFGLGWEGAQGAYARLYSFSASVQSASTSTAVNVGINTTNPESPFTILGIGSASAANDVTLAKQWKTQQAIYATSAYALKFGAHYTPGVGAYSSIQSTEFYSGTEHPGQLVLQPIGGSVGIGTTEPGEKLTVRGPSASTYAAGYAAIGLYTGFGGQNVSGSEQVVTRITMGSYGPYIQNVIPNMAYVDGCRLDLCTNAASNNATAAPRITIMGGATSFNSGFVGIGTTSPQAPLHVATYTNVCMSTSGCAITGLANSGNGFYFNYGNSLNAWSNTWGANVSIFGMGSLLTGESFIAASDERVKKNIQPIADALDKIRLLDVVSYDRIDYREKGVDAGVVARNVRSVLPKAVHTSRHMIPNIYLPATHMKIRSGVLVEVKCDDKDIKEGSKVKLMIVQGDKEIEHVSNMTNWTGSSFEVEEWKEYSEEDKVFAYGVEVDDFLNVDKEQVGILAAGAVKELDGIVAEQSREISELKRLVRSLLG